MLGFFGGVEAGIGFWDAGAGFGQVGVQGFAQGGGAVGVLFCQVGLFAGVGGDVVEFVAAVFVVVDELPGEVECDGGGFAALVAVVGGSARRACGCGRRRSF